MSVLAVFTWYVVALFAFKQAFENKIFAGNSLSFQGKKKKNGAVFCDLPSGTQPLVLK